MFHPTIHGTIPKTKVESIQQISVASVNIDLFYFSSMPGVKGIGPWIACEVWDKWYLQKCDGVSGKKIPRNHLYTCKKCQV